MWDKVVNFFQTYGLKIIIAIAIFLAGIIIIKILLQIIKKIFEKTRLENATAKFLRTCIKVILYVLLFMVICQYVGIPMTGFVAVISAAGLAISLALQGSLSNLANGVVIISTKPFKEGDYVSIGSIEGTVVEIKMMHTILQTIDNKEISIPNQTVVGSEIVNFNKQKTRKLLIEVSVSYATDVKKVKSILNNIMINNDKVFLDPSPTVQLVRFDSSSIVFRTDCWCKSEDYWTLKFDLHEKIFNELKREKIDIPYEQMEVRLRNDIVKMPYDTKALPKRSKNALTSLKDDEKEGLLFRYIIKPSKKIKSKNDKSENEENKYTSASKNLKENNHKTKKNAKKEIENKTTPHLKNVDKEVLKESSKNNFALIEKKNDTTIENGKTSKSSKQGVNKKNNKDSKNFKVNPKKESDKMSKTAKNISKTNVNSSKSKK